MSHDRFDIGRALILLAGGLLCGCGGNGPDGEGRSERSGGDDRPRGSVSAVDVKKVKAGMSLPEVETLLGKSEEATAPKGKGMPLGVYMQVDGKVKYVNCTYRKWRVGGKSYVVGFLNGRVTGLLRGGPAVVEE